MKRKSRFEGIMTWLALLIFAMLAPSGHAAKICREFTVYFDSGKDALNLPAQKQLDSLMRSWGKWEILAELEGHTDSVKGVEYNQLLSAARVASVHQYLEQHYASKITVREFAQSETKPVADNGTDVGKARNRRVVIKYVVLVGGNLKVVGKQGQEISFPISVAGECGVCGSDFNVNYFKSDAEIAIAGYGMGTVDGDTLTTGGMMDFSCGCDGVKTTPKPFPACFKFPVRNLGPEFGAWRTNRAGLWERVKDFEIRNDTMIVCIPDFDPRVGINGDCPEIRKYSFVDSTGYKILESSLRRDLGGGRYVDYLPRKYYGDSLMKCTYHCVALDGNSNLWVCNMPLKHAKNKLLFPDYCTTIEKMWVETPEFKQIKFEWDMVQRLKVPRKAHITKVTYQLEDPDTSFQFTQVKKRKFESPILKYPHTVRFESADGKVYDRKPKTIKLKHKRRIDRMVGRLKEL
jgi:OmpA family